jgi:metal-dependent amidase/aminoacylase/carboxypeptidase family protein
MVFLTMMIFLIATAYAQSKKSKESIASKVELAMVSQLVDSDSARLVEIFKDLHENPELDLMETRTAGIVAKELQALGYKVITNIGKTGVARTI